MNDLSNKLLELRSVLRSMGSVAVAYSGGTDSAFLLKVATEELGDKAVAVMFVSPWFPEWERERGESVAREIGAMLEMVRINELSPEEFVRNGKDRCYHCKKALLLKIWNQARSLGLAQVIDGNNADDAVSSRQGLRAVQETGTRSPLAEVGLNKKEIRELARQMGLSNWDKPASACLASRIPFDVRLTKEKMEAVEKGEDLLRSFGIGQIRLRHHGDIARIEVLPEDFKVIIENREALIDGLRKIGFSYICLDIEGFRSGSLEQQRS